MQSGAHRGAFKRDDLKSAETVAQERIALARYRANRARQLNLPGGARSIWNAADRSFGADAFLKNNASRRAAHDGLVAAVIADGSNESLVTCGGNDGVVRVWAFNSQKLRGEICLSSSFSSGNSEFPRIKDGETTVGNESSPRKDTRRADSWRWRAATRPCACWTSPACAACAR